MEDYLQKLSDMIESKNLRRFSVLPDEKTFKIIKKNSTEMKKMFKANPEKYKGRMLASIGLDAYPEGFKRKNDIFGIHVTIYRIHEDGSIDRYLGDSWLLYIKYLPEDLEKHPFKMKNVEKLIKLAYKRKVVTPSNGVFYKRFEELLEESKEKKNKNNRSVKRSKKSIKNKRSLKNKRSVKRSKKVKMFKK